MKNLLSAAKTLLAGNSSDDSSTVIIVCVICAIVIFVSIYMIIYLKVIKKQKQTMQNRIDEYLRRNNFNVTNIFVSEKEADGSMSEALYIDDAGQKFAVIRKSGKTETIRILPYAKLAGYEIYQNNDKTATGGSGDAMLAGFLFGGLTALAVSNANKTEKTTCASLEVHLKIDEIQALEIFTFIRKVVMTDSAAYVDALKNAKALASALEHILKVNGKAIEM